MWALNQKVPKERNYLWYPSIFLKYIYIYFAHFLILITIFLTVTMGKGIDGVYKYRHINWPYPSTITTFVVPSISANQTPQVTTSGISDSLDNWIQTKPSSSHNQTKKLYGAVNIDDISNNFANPRKNKHSVT